MGDDQRSKTEEAIIKRQRRAQEMADAKALERKRVEEFLKFALPDNANLSRSKAEQKKKKKKTRRREKKKEASGNRVYLNVPYVEKDNAKSLGAKWDQEEKKWYADGKGNLQKFAKWMNCKDVNIRERRRSTNVGAENKVNGEWITGSNYKPHAFLPGQFPWD